MTATPKQPASELTAPALTAMVDSIFRPEGLLFQLFGFEYREQQHQYALAVAAWLTQEGPASVAMLEGETGIGKSLAYLLPLAIQLSVTGRRALISTYTVHLIQQLGKDKAIIDRVFTHLSLCPIKICNRLGRAQYVAASKVLELAEETENKDDQKALLRWHKKICQSPGPHVYLSWWYENAVITRPDEDIHLGLTEYSTPEDAIWYQTDCQMANEADLVLTSHTVTSLCARGVSLFGSQDGSQGKPFSYLIADEADRLADSAESLYRLRSSPLRIANLCRELQNACEWKSQQTNRVCNELKSLQGIIDEAGSFYKDQPSVLSGDLPSHIGTRFTASVKASLAAMKPLVESIQPSIEAPASKLNTLSGFYKSLNSLLTDRYQSSCLAWSPVNRIGSVAIDNPFAGLSFSRWLRGISDHQPPVAVMLTSGTLGISAQQGMSRYAPLRSSLGINEGDVSLYGHYAPKQYGTIQFVLAGDVPAPFVGEAYSAETSSEKNSSEGSQYKTSDEEANDDGRATYSEPWLAFTVRMLKACVEQGKTLCLCPSFAEVAELQALVDQPEIGFHCRGSRLDELIEQLQAGKLTAIVTPSAWEGVSIRAKDGRQLLNNIMVTRIPIQPPNRVTENAFAARYVANGRNRDEARKVLFSRVRDRGLRKFKQGLIGRGIRASQDQVTAWVADPRIGPDRRYRLLGVIPDRFFSHFEEAEYFQPNGERTRPEPKTDKEVLVWI